MVIPGNVILISSHKSACQEPKQPEQLRAAPCPTTPIHGTGRVSSSLPRSPARKCSCRCSAQRTHLISYVTILALSKEPLNSGDTACSQAADSEWPGSRWAFQVKKRFLDRCGFAGNSSFSSSLQRCDQALSWRDWGTAERVHKGAEDW